MKCRKAKVLKVKQGNESLLGRELWVADRPPFLDAPMDYGTGKPLPLQRVYLTPYFSARSGLVVVPVGDVTLLPDTGEVDALPLDIWRQPHG